MAENNTWISMFRTSTKAPEAAAAPKPRPMVDPEVQEAQRRGTAYYFKTGKQLPTEAFLKDKNLGK